MLVRYSLDPNDKGNNKEATHSEGFDLMKIVTLEMKINDLKLQITKLEGINKDYEEKLYGKNSSRMNEVHVIIYTLIKVFL